MWTMWNQRRVLSRLAQRVAEQRRGRRRPRSSMTTSSISSAATVTTPSHAAAMRHPFWLNQETVDAMPKLALPAAPVVVDSIDGQKSAVAEITTFAGEEDGGGVVGFDSETRVLFPKRKGEKVPQLPVAVIQLSTLSRAYVFRLRIEEEGTVREVGIAPELRDLLSGEGGVTLVSHGLHNDLITLSRHYSEVSASSSRGICLEKCSQAIPSFPQSLNGNCGVFLGLSLNKSRRLTLGNWEAKKLSPAMLDYAAVDAYASLAVFREMRRIATAGVAVTPPRPPPPPAVAAVAAAARTASNAPGPFHPLISTGDGSPTRWELTATARLRLCQALNGLPFARVKQPRQLMAEAEAQAADAGEGAKAEAEKELVEGHQDRQQQEERPYRQEVQELEEQQEQQGQREQHKQQEQQEQQGRQQRLQQQQQEEKELHQGDSKERENEEKSKEQPPPIPFEERLAICAACKHS